MVSSRLAAGFAETIGQLIAIRAVQGLGIGGLMALSQAIIGDVVAVNAADAGDISAGCSVWRP